MTICVLPITKFFDIKSGNYHATKDLDDGEVPLISCGSTNNGLVGYFNIPPEKTYFKTITVAYNGIPLTARYHPYNFGAKDDVAVLIPLKTYQEKTLLYIATVLNSQTWRYSYGRKCFKGKLEELQLPIPINESDEIDETYINSLIVGSVSDYIPVTNPMPLQTPVNLDTTKIFELSDIFDIDNGNFHSVGDLDEGETPLVSCSENDNGIVGYFNINEDDIFENSITVTFDGKPLTVKYHPYKFSAYDNVGILIPKISIKDTTLLFISSLISLQSWRYSYGRKCYKSKMQKFNISLPVDDEGRIDENIIESIVMTNPYSDVVLSH